MPGDGGRGGLGSGERGTRAGQPVALGAPGSPKDSAEVVDGSRNGARLELGGGGIHGGGTAWRARGGGADGLK
jgi:hypothetical protein